MSHRLVTTALLLASLVSAAHFVTNLISRRDIPLPKSKKFNVESWLALGKPVPLSHCEIPDLELIPTIGPATAQKLFDHREEILDRARGLREPALALVTIKGIGPSTAEKIAPWLIFE